MRLESSADFWISYWSKGNNTDAADFYKRCVIAIGPEVPKKEAHIQKSWRCLVRHKLGEASPAVELALLNGRTRSSG